MKFSVRVLSLFVLVVGLYGCATNQARISTPIEGRLLSLHGMVITGSVTVDSLKEQGATCRNSLGNWQVTCVSDLDGQTKASYIFSYNKLSQVNVMFMNGGVASYGEALSSLGLTVTKPDVMSSELRAVCNNVPTVKKSPQCTTLKWTQKYLGVKEI
ncbi:MAG: hypothetical protein OSB62_07285, partial [Alphaproteobacteria bacterium]|nr:hypothetical protein [Alphaproteobacteria bacterium]